MVCSTYRFIEESFCFGVESNVAADLPCLGSGDLCECARSIWLADEAFSRGYLIIRQEKLGEKEMLQHGRLTGFCQVKNSGH